MTKDTGEVEAVTLRGNDNAFVHPGDNQLIGAAEYLENGLPGKSSVDTRRLLDEFRGM